MPELPEVETTRRGLAPWCRGEVVEALVVREPRLRWPVPQRRSESSDQPSLGEVEGNPPLRSITPQTSHRFV